MPEENSPPKLWMCPNCGQIHFGDFPPDMCAFCKDFTTWRPYRNESISEPKTNRAPQDDNKDKH